MDTTFDIEHLDTGIEPIVKLFNEHGIMTFESCEGGKGHIFPEPIVRFHGGIWEGFRAYALAVYHGFNVFNLRRYWTVSDGELTGPEWEMTFHQSSISSPNGN